MKEAVYLWGEHLRQLGGLPFQDNLLVGVNSM